MKIYEMYERCVLFNSVFIEVYFHSYMFYYVAYN